MEAPKAYVMHPRSYGLFRGLSPGLMGSQVCPLTIQCCFPSLGERKILFWVTMGTKTWNPAEPQNAIKADHRNLLNPQQGRGRTPVWVAFASWWTSSAPAEPLAAECYLQGSGLDWKTIVLRICLWIQKIPRQGDRHQILGFSEMPRRCQRCC